MDSTNEDVHKIKSNLLSSRQRLHVLDTLKHEALPSHGKNIQGALKSADVQADTVQCQLSTFVRGLEYVDHASSSVNLQPQIAWLYDQLTAINQNLELADQHVTDAMTFTNEHCYSLMDITSQVKTQSIKLKEHEEKTRKRIAQAKEDMKQAAAKAVTAKASIQSNERDIEAKKLAITNLEQKQAQLESEVATKQTEKEKANKNRKESRNWAVGSGITTGLLLAAAPFTFGVTGGIAVATGIVMGVTIDDSLDHKKKVKQLHASISDAKDTIRSHTQAISSHKIETERLKNDIVSYQNEIKAKEVELENLERQVGTCSQAMKEMTSLDSHAASTLTNLRHAVPDLQHVRDVLEKCGDLVKERSVEVKSSADLTYKIAKRIPVIGTKIKRKKDYQNQMLVIGEASKTLEKLHGALPSLLSTQSAALLDVKPWNSVKVSVFDVGEDIPDMRLF